MEGRNIPIKFIAVPEYKENKTLLGVDFISDANMILDIRGMRWHFADYNVRYDFYQDPAMMKTSVPVSATDLSTY